MASTDHNSDSSASPENRLAAVRAQVADAAGRAGRDAKGVTLVAVSKTFSADMIQPVIDAGQRVFGENRVQESLSKWPDLKAAHPDIDLHLIGPLQSNKAKEAVGLFDSIHTIDRPKIARVIAQETKAQGRDLKLFIQVNTGEEEQKSGVMPRDADAFITQCRDEFGLTISGLMCIPPLDDEPSLHFALLASIAERNGLNELSMGMSADFETAIVLGATHVRVGTAVFGQR